jgi:poly-gamma-glutamate synthesis protein (capsule biosynthesis protein)
MLRLLYLSGIITLFLSGGQLINSPLPKPTVAKTPEKLVSFKSPIAEDDSSEVKLLFAGDIMSQLLQIQSAEIAPDRYDFESCFQYIRPVLERADVALANLEFTMPGHPPYTGYPNFRSPDTFAEAIAHAGFDILVTANNHSNDGGLEGITHTLETLDKNHLLHTGTFSDSMSKRLYYPFIFYKKGIKFALVNYTLHTNGIKTTNPASVNYLEIADFQRDITLAKQMKPDFIIAFVHWGVEYALHENEEQTVLSRLLHRAGADIVVGSHPHVVQPIKLIYEKEKPQLTAYSLGNFISAQPYDNTEGGILFEVDVKKVRGKTSIIDYRYLPVLRYTPNGVKGKYFALPISVYEDTIQNVLKMPLSERVKMRDFARNTRNRLDSFGVQERILDLKALKKVKQWQF